MTLHRFMTEREASDFCELCNESGVDRIILEHDLFFRMYSIALSEKWIHGKQKKDMLRVRSFIAKKVRFIHKDFKNPSSFQKVTRK